MEELNEIVLSDEKFHAIPMIREVLSCFETNQYSGWGSFLSAVLFKTQFSGSFEILVRDETEAYEILGESFKVDSLHATVDINSPLKFKLIDATSRNELMRQYLIEHTESRTCVIANKAGELEKFDLEVPRRGALIVALLLEIGEDPQNIASVVSKIIWSLENIGVGPLLRDVKFAPKNSVNRSADIVEEFFINRANKTITMLSANKSLGQRDFTAADLKRLGRPYAALLRA